MPTPLLLIDGSSYFFRAFHALPPLINTQGQPTGAVYGVANMIRRLLKDYQPTHIAVVFDASGKTFRHTLYPEYKAHRPPTPPDLRCQFQPLIELLKCMGLPLLIIEGVEADDVIGTLAAHATQQQWPVVISTGDKDMAQLVNEHITLINTMNQTTLDVAGVKTKFGVAPTQMIDYLALVGDTSDNVPGVKQCGPKTAVKWLTTYHNLDTLITHAHEISGKIGESLRASLEQLELSKQLVTIKTDVDLPATLEELTLQPIDQAQLLTCVEALEFKTWITELRTQIKNTSPPVVEAPSQQGYTLITDMLTWNTYLQRIQQSKLVCVDTETTSLDVMQAELVGLSFAMEGEETATYVPLAHTDGTPQLDRTTILASLKPWLEKDDAYKVGQNMKYDYGVFQNYGITWRGMAFDTMLESYLLNSTGSRHDLDTLALKYLNHQNITYADVAGTGRQQLRFDDVPVAKAAPYAAEDADVALRLHHHLEPLLAPTLHKVLHDIEMPLISVLADIERHGVLIDPELLATHGVRLKADIHALEQEAYALAGVTFNLNSPKQLQDILYNVLHLPILSKTPTGQPSTAESVLEELALNYRLPAVLVEYRQLTKLVSTYIDALPKRINPKTQRVHTSYNQAVTATGRLSSTDPNLQNIPVRREEGRLIRRAFIAPAQHVLLSADYSQIELRIMAHLSQDHQLLHAFGEGWDIHAATASEIFGVQLNEVTSEQRRRAKAVNFGLIYGMSAFGLAKQLGIERQDAQRYLDCYFQRYPGVLTYMERTREQAHQQGFVETLFGRRLYLPEINSHNGLRRKAAERMAINAPMQGSAADIIKKAMIAIAQWQREQTQPMATMIMQVHDELVFEVNENLIDQARMHIKKHMETTVLLSVPLCVSIGVGRHWDEAHA